MKIQIESATLTDGSKVFNVRLGEIVFPTYSETDAGAFAQKLRHAIADHTTEIATVEDNRQ